MVPYPAPTHAVSPGISTEIGHVQNVGDSLEVVAAAADLELNPEFLGANDGGGDVGFRRGGENRAGFPGGGLVEAAVSHGGEQNILEAGVLRRVDGGRDFGGGNAILCEAVDEGSVRAAICSGGEKKEDDENNFSILLSF
ncbi:hypothetical protein M569_12390 [Genlisea aurea]|uniref:Uncharacterized protein n=1 Tax=Genlisea aurea TaxID=192259 RepID=S8CD86_9LAMI|nr:hypothetical protein M569_12390 [Genlisea aurea]